MKKHVVWVLALVLCLGSALALAGGGAERMLFEEAGFSLQLPAGWEARDLTETIRQQEEAAGAEASDMQMLGYIMVGDPNGLSMIAINVSRVPDGYDAGADLAAMAEALGDAGVWMDIGGHQFLAYTYEVENKNKRVMGFVNGRIYDIMGEVLNEGLEATFDGVIATMEIEP